MNQSTLLSETRVASSSSSSTSSLSKDALLLGSPHGSRHGSRGRDDQKTPESDIDQPMRARGRVALDPAPRVEIADGKEQVDPGFIARPVNRMRPLMAPEEQDEKLASPCIWIGNVDPAVTETELRSLFEQFGTVSLIRMFPHSRCAFITYQRTEDANKASALEGYVLHDMPLTLNQGQATRHLWLGNVGESVSEVDLVDVFSRFGAVQSVRILRNKSSAFVNFLDKRHALTAFEVMNGAVIGSNALVINFQWEESVQRLKRRGKQPFAPPMQSPRGRGGFAGRGGRGRGRGGLAQHNADHMMYATFETDAFQMQDDLEVAESVLRTPESPAPANLHSRESSRDSGYVPMTVPPSRQLFVGHVPPYLTEDHLITIFSRFGELEGVRSVAYRGFAFVTFRRLPDAVYARQFLIERPAIVGDHVLTVNFGLGHNARSAGPRKTSDADRDRPFSSSDSAAARSSLWSPPSSFSRPVSVPSVISPMPLLGDDAMRSINQSRPQSVRFEETKSSYRAGSDVPPRAMAENQSSAMATYAAMQSVQPFSR